jgi:hypothetical protein
MPDFRGQNRRIRFNASKTTFPGKISERKKGVLPMSCFWSVFGGHASPTKKELTIGPVAPNLTPIFPVQKNIAAKGFFEGAGALQLRRETERRRGQEWATNYASRVTVVMGAGTRSRWCAALQLHLIHNSKSC